MMKIVGLRQSMVPLSFLPRCVTLRKYIKPCNRVLEVGAGTGRYSYALARQGYAVDALELIEQNIEVFRKNIQPNENITIIQGNANDLSSFSDNEYDITVRSAVPPLQLRG